MTAAVSACKYLGAVQVLVAFRRFMVSTAASKDHRHAGTDGSAGGGIDGAG